MCWCNLHTWFVPSHPACLSCPFAQHYLWFNSSEESVHCVTLHDWLAEYLRALRLFPLSAKKYENMTHSTEEEHTSERRGTLIWEQRCFLVIAAWLSGKLNAEGHLNYLHLLVSELLINVKTASLDVLPLSHQLPGWRRPLLVHSRMLFSN